MPTIQDPEARTRQDIEEAELKLHRLYESRDRAPADEKAVVNAQIEEMKHTIDHLRTQLHN